MSVQIGILPRKHRFGDSYQYGPLFEGRDKCDTESLSTADRLHRRTSSLLPKEDTSHGNRDRILSSRRRSYAGHGLHDEHTFTRRHHLYQRRPVESPTRHGVPAPHAETGAGARANGNSATTSPSDPGDLTAQARAAATIETTGICYRGYGEGRSGGVGDCVRVADRSEGITETGGTEEGDRSRHNKERTPLIVVGNAASSSAAFEQRRRHAQGAQAEGSHDCGDLTEAVAKESSSGNSRVDRGLFRDSRRRMEPRIRDGENKTIEFTSDGCGVQDARGDHDSMGEATATAGVPVVTSANAAKEAPGDGATESNTGKRDGVSVRLRDDDGRFTSESANGSESEVETSKAGRRARVNVEQLGDCMDGKDGDGFLHEEASVQVEFGNTGVWKHVHGEGQSRFLIAVAFYPASSSNPRERREKFYRDTAYGGNRSSAFCRPMYVFRGSNY